MASLRNIHTGENILLAAHHVIGRHPESANLVLSNPKVSRLHATIIWNGLQWAIRDTSSNGSYVNGIKLTPKAVNELNVGDRISFVKPDTDIFEVSDLSPPKSMLLPISQGTEAIILEDIVPLPDENSAQITLFQGWDGCWNCESEAGVRRIVSGDEISASGEVWRFVEAKTSVDTVCLSEPDIIGLNDVKAHFDVSQNEEHVYLTLKVNSEKFQLGEKSHHYLLLLLARKFKEDRLNGVVASEQGWIDKDLLITMLGQTEVYLNVQIYRFRKLTSGLFSEGQVFPQLLERRKGEIRFCCKHVEIHVAGRNN